MMLMMMVMMGGRGEMPEAGRAAVLAWGSTQEMSALLLLLLLLLLPTTSLLDCTLLALLSAWLLSACHYTVGLQPVSIAQPSFYWLQIIFPILPRWGARWRWWYWSRDGSWRWTAVLVHPSPTQLISICFFICSGRYKRHVMFIGVKKWSFEASQLKSCYQNECFCLSDFDKCIFQHLFKLFVWLWAQAC